MASSLTSGAAAIAAICGAVIGVGAAVCAA